MSYPFTETPALCGPLRRPRQMLADHQLNHAVMKASYAAYDREAAELAEREPGA